MLLNQIQVQFNLKMHKFTQTQKENNELKMQSINKTI